MSKPKDRVELSHTPDYDGDNIEDMLAGGADIDELIADGYLDDDDDAEREENQRLRLEEWRAEISASKGRITEEFVEF